MKLEALSLDIDIDDSEYQLTVTAFNEGQTFAGTLACVRILVKDLNNKNPTFSDNDNDVITIPENMASLYHFSESPILITTFE